MAMTMAMHDCKSQEGIVTRTVGPWVFHYVVHSPLVCRFTRFGIELGRVGCTLCGVLESNARGRDFWFELTVILHFALCTSFAVGKNEIIINPSLSFP